VGAGAAGKEKGLAVWKLLDAEMLPLDQSSLALPQLNAGSGDWAEVVLSRLGSCARLL
jgi:hypothetical protein